MTADFYLMHRFTHTILFTSLRLLSTIGEQHRPSPTLDYCFVFGNEFPSVPSYLLENNKARREM